MELTDVPAADVTTLVMSSGGGETAARVPCPVSQLRRHNGP